MDVRRSRSRRRSASVVDEDRGSLPFALIHGEALVACAAWALGEAGVTAVDLGTPWAALVDADEPFVLHDALCPMTPAGFIAACVTSARSTPRRVVVGVRPVTDTVKRVDGRHRRRRTVDRDGLRRRRLAGRAAARRGRAPSTRCPTPDFAALVAALRERVPGAAARGAARGAAGSRRRTTSALLEALTAR